MSNRFLMNSVSFVLSILLLMGAGSVLAQELTGTLYGRVVDASGSRIPGATVTVSSPQLIKGTEVRVTGNEGTYRVPTLPPGVYTVKIELPGFQTMTHEEIVLEAGASLAIDVTLSISTVEETVTVTGESPIIDVRNTKTQRIVDSAIVENLPSANRFDELLVTAPGVIDSQYGFAPAQTVHGGSVRDNVSYVDGANVNDNTVGYTFTDLPYDILDEVQITSGGISAEFGQASGAVFNFVTKSGGNQHEGNVNFFLQNEGLQGDNLTDELIAQGLEQGTTFNKNVNYGFTMGGPIQQDKVWYFGNIRRFDIDFTRPDFPARDIDISDTQGFVKITTQLAENTRLMGSYTQRDRTEFPTGASFRNNDAPETWRDADRYQKIIFVSLTQVLNENTYMDVKFVQTLQQSGGGFVNSEIPGGRDIGTGLDCCGWTRTVNNYKNREKRNIKANFSYFSGDFLGGEHNLQAGFEYEFAPLWRRFELPDEMLHRYRNEEAFRIRLYQLPVLQGRHVNRQAGFVQDAWTLKDRVTLNLGGRFEWSEGFHPEQTGGGGRWFPEVTFPEQRNQIDWFTVAPRLGLVWDVKGDQRTSFKLNFGRYYVALLNQNMSLALKNAASFQEYDWNDLNGDLFFQDGEQGTLRRNFSTNLDEFDPNLKAPYTDALHVGVEQQVGNNFAISVTGIFKRDRDILETIDKGRPFSAYDPITVINPVDGQSVTAFALRPEFVGAQRIRYLTTPTDPVPLERNYQGIEFAARKRMSDGWQFSGSLNLSRSDGNIGNSFGATTGGRSVYDNPNTLINIDGPLDLDAPVQIKLVGSYQAPYQIMVSAFYQGISGFPIKPDAGFPPTNVLGAPTIRVFAADNPAIVVESFIEFAGEPRGTRRQDFLHRLSFRAEKEIALGSRLNLDLTADVFNVLNVSTVTAVQTLRFDLSSFNRPAVIELPRTLQIGVRLRF